MEKVIALILLCVIIYASSGNGCTNMYGQFMQYWSRGSTSSYKECIDSNKSIGISDSAVTYICKNRHCHSISPQTSGKSAYRVDVGWAAHFYGFIQNESTNTVITSFVLNINHKDNIDKSGNPIVEKLNVDNIWIEPGDRHRFDISDLNFRPKEDRLYEGKDFLYSWHLSDIKGLNILLR